MWRGSRTLRCVAHDFVTGIPSDYRPRYRPRRLVVPVDRWNQDGDKRQDNPEFVEHINQKKVLLDVRRRGAMQLSSPPRERTAADGVRLALDTAVAEGLTNQDELLTANEGYKKLAAALKKHSEALSRQEKGVAESTTSSTVSSSSSVVALGIDGDRALEQSPRAYRIWELLEKTTMDAPAHGVLSLRGKALVESTLLAALYDLYPRMRSRHAQHLVHQSCGLLSISRVAGRLGMIDSFQIHTECGLWRELNTLKERFRVARQMATIHKERANNGLMAQRRWFWRSALKSAGSRLKTFPVTAEDLLPRMEWLRHQVFQWIASVEELEGPAVARTLALRLFCAPLGRKWHTTQLERQVHQALQGDNQSPDAHKSNIELHEARQALEVALHGIARDSSGRPTTFVDAIDANDTYHPLNDHGQLRREQKNSSFGTLAMQPIMDDVQRARWKSAEHLAPPQVVDLVDPVNAFREIQLILKYDPFVSEELRNAPIDVDVTIGTSVEVVETNSQTLHSDYQQFRQVEVKEVKLFAGHHCIGVGKGATELLATQEASVQALLNYYLREGTAFDTDVMDEKGHTAAAASVGAVVAGDDEVSRSVDDTVVSAEHEGVAVDGGEASFDVMDVIMGVESTTETSNDVGASPPSPPLDESSYFF